MEETKGNSWMIRTLTGRKQWVKSPNWVGFSDAWPNKKLTVPLIKTSSLLDPRRHRP